MPVTEAPKHYGRPSSFDRYEAALASLIVQHPAVPGSSSTIPTFVR